MNNTTATKSTDLDNTIKNDILTIVSGNMEADDSMHYREILDDIISDLQQYVGTLPTADEHFAKNEL
jgi:hypothetical protein